MNAAFISQAYECKARLPGFLDSCNFVLDGLASMICCFFLAENIQDINVLGDSYLSHDRFTEGGSYLDRDRLMSKFIDTMSYSFLSSEGSSSSAPIGRSTRLIQQVMITLSTMQVNMLKKMLPERN